MRPRLFQLWSSFFPLPLVSRRACDHGCLQLVCDEAFARYACGRNILAAAHRDAVVVVALRVLVAAAAAAAAAGAAAVVAAVAAAAADAAAAVAL